MASPEVHHLFHAPIADHSFSADRNTLAVTRANNVELYGKQGSLLLSIHQIYFCLYSMFP